MTTKYSAKRVAEDWYIKGEDKLMNTTIKFFHQLTTGNVYLSVRNTNEDTIIIHNVVISSTDDIWTKYGVNRIN